MSQWKKKDPQFESCKREKGRSKLNHLLNKFKTQAIFGLHVWVWVLMFF